MFGFEKSINYSRFGFERRCRHTGGFKNVCCQRRIWNERDNSCDSPKYDRSFSSAQYSAEIVRAQIDAVFNDINVDGVKIGMLSTADIANAVADAMEVYKPRILIVDPVMVSTSGSKLLSDEAVEVIKNRLCRLQLWLHRIFPRLNICAGRRLKIFMRWGRQLRLLVIWVPDMCL